MPALSRKQRRFMGMVHAFQKGELDTSASPAIKKAASSMTEKESYDYASTKEKGLPMYSNSLMDRRNVVARAAKARMKQKKEKS